MRAFEFQFCVVLGIMMGALHCASLGAAEPNGKPDAKPAERAIAAVVNGDPIYVAEIEKLAVKARGARVGPLDKQPGLVAETLRQTVNQRVIEEVLKREAYLKESDIDKAVEQIKAQGKAKGMTVEELAERQGVTVNTMRHELAWQIGWPKYIERNLADALQGYFKEHHADFDGTMVRASHILLRPDSPVEGRNQTIERAEKIRAEIEAEKLTFEQAAEKYSVGPSRTQGGDLGFFPRFGVMVDDFSKAAFELAVDEISKPVSTAFGVHLIQVTEIKRGARQWTEAADRMKAPAAADMFKKLAEQESANAKIEFTGKMPYFDPKTDELIMPGAKKKE